VGLPAWAPLASRAVSDEQRARTQRLLRRVVIVALVDFILLVALLSASLSDAEGAVGILGPVHGLGFLLELYLTVRGAGERLWGWWFPAAVVITAGPLGALIGHRVVARRLAARPMAAT